MPASDDLRTEGSKTPMERFDKFHEGHDQARRDLFHFGDFARPLELAPETAPKMQAAE